MPIAIAANGNLIQMSDRFDVPGLSPRLAARMAEIEPFHVGTVTVASAAAELTRANRLMSVAGGGDTVAALVKAAVLGDFSYVSTAGGAFLEWLEGRDLPGVAVLRG